LKQALKSDILFSRITIKGVACFGLVR